MTPEKYKLLYNLLIAGCIIFIIWQINREQRNHKAYKADCKTKYLYIKRRISLTRSIKDLSDIEDEIHAFYADFKYKVDSEILKDWNGRLWAGIHNKGCELMGKVLVSN